MHLGISSVSTAPRACHTHQGTEKGHRRCKQGALVCPDTPTRALHTQPPACPQEPVAFVAGVVAGVLDLNITRDPLRTWIATEAGTPLVCTSVCRAGGPHAVSTETGCTKPPPKATQHAGTTSSATTWWCTSNIALMYLNDNLLLPLLIITAVLTTHPLLCVCARPGNTTQIQFTIARPPSEPPTAVCCDTPKTRIA